MALPLQVLFVLLFRLSFLEVLSQFAVVLFNVTLGLQVPVFESLVPLDFVYLLLRSCLVV